MRLRNRILLAFSTVLVAASVYLFNSLMDEAKPRYREAVEESLNDTVTILAALLQEDVRAGRPDTARLARAVGMATRRRLSARIYSLMKTRVDLRVYVTDAAGVVVYDSDGGRDVVVEVSDTGTGIPEYAMDRIFERFYSLERPGTGRKSSGLGLAFVREVAALHGGEVHIENRAGGGAAARLSIPRSPSPEH